LKWRNTTNNQSTKGHYKIVLAFVTLIMLDGALLIAHDSLSSIKMSCVATPAPETTEQNPSRSSTAPSALSGSDDHAGGLLWSVLAERPGRQAGYDDPCGPGVSAAQVYQAAARAQQIDQRKQQALKQAQQKQAGPSSGLHSPGPDNPKAATDADALALATLRSCGLSPAEVSEAWYIHSHEGGWRSVSASGCYGGWQIMLSAHTGITETQAFDPAWSTKWAVNYMRGRYGSVGAAYDHKKGYGWY